MLIYPGELHVFTAPSSLALSSSSLAHLLTNHSLSFTIDNMRGTLETTSVKKNIGREKTLTTYTIKTLYAPIALIRGFPTRHLGPRGSALQP